MHPKPNKVWKRNGKRSVYCWTYIQDAVGALGQLVSFGWTHYVIITFWVCEADVCTIGAKQFTVLQNVSSTFARWYIGRAKGDTSLTSPCHAWSKTTKKTKSLPFGRLHILSTNLNVHWKPNKVWKRNGKRSVYCWTYMQDAVQALGQLVSVNWTHYCAYISDLSNS